MCANNCIIFNNDKTVGMIHQNRKFKANVEPNIMLDGRYIKFVNSVKYLGVLITNDLFDDLDINQRGPTTGPRNNFVRPAEQFCTIQVLSIISSGNLL